MKGIHFVLILLSVILCLSNIHAHDDSTSTEQKWTELSLDTFDGAISGQKFAFVKFYAPWCGACKRFEPEFEKLVEELGSSIYFAKFNAWDEKVAHLTSKYNVSGYPTLVFFRNGNPESYQGDFNADAVSKTLKKKIRDSLVEIHNVKEADALLAEDDLAVVGLFKEKYDKEYDTLLSYSEKLNEVVRFGYSIVKSNDDSLLQHFQVKTLPAIVLLKRFDEKQAVLSTTDLPNLEEIIETHRFPILDEISKENSRTYIDAGIPIGFFFVETEEQRSQYKEILSTVGKENRRKLNVVFIDWVKYGAQAKKLGLSGTKVPSFAIEDTKLRDHYAFPEEEELNENNLRNFIGKFVSKELKPTLVSEPVPETSEGHVVKVVGLNFQEVVLDSDKHVLLEYYAPWCGHCNKLAPVWEQLAEAFKDDDKIVVAKIDATANDYLDEEKVGSFPTIKLYKANQKNKPVPYTPKDRSLEALTAWLKENTSSESTGKKDTSKDEL